MLGDIRKVDDGVTIEINNTSNLVISNLKFFFGLGDSHVIEELGNIESLSPGEKAKIHIPLQNTIYSDHSLYMQHMKNSNQPQIETLADIAVQYPYKIGVKIEITGTDDEGNLLYKLRGFDGFHQYDMDISIKS